MSSTMVLSANRGPLPLEADDFKRCLNYLLVAFGTAGCQTISLPFVGGPLDGKSIEVNQRLIDGLALYFPNGEGAQSAYVVRKLDEERAELVYKSRQQLSADGRGM